MTTDVTNFKPKSQGGTRTELLKVYAHTGLPEDAKAARLAGASQKELQVAATLFHERYLDS